MKHKVKRTLKVRPDFSRTLWHSAMNIATWDALAAVEYAGDYLTEGSGAAIGMRQKSATAYNSEDMGGGGRMTAV